MTRRPLLLALPLLAGMLACSTVRVNVPVTHPVDIDLEGRRLLVVEPFEGPAGVEVAALLRTELVRAGHSQVEGVDRQAIDRRPPPPSAVAIVGQVHESGYVESPVTWSEYELTDGADRKTRHRRFYRNGIARVRVTVRIDDLATGKALATRTFEHEEPAATTAVDRQPAFIDGEAMVRRGREKVVGRFVRSIVPWTRFERASFRKDGALPQLEAAIALCRAGEWDRAYALVTRAIDDGEGRRVPSKVLGKAYWNRALIGKYTGRFDQARADAKRAFEHTNDRDTLWELRRIDEREIRTQRFRESHPPTPVVRGEPSWPRPGDSRDPDR